MATLFSVHTSNTNFSIFIVLISCFTNSSTEVQQTKLECVNVDRNKSSVEHGTAENTVNLQIQTNIL